MYVMGIDPTKVRTTTEGPEFGLGQLGANAGSAGTKIYMYVRDSGSAITGDGYVVDIDSSAFTAVMTTTTTGAPGTGQGKQVGVARAAIAASGYGWVQIYGSGNIRVSASCAAYTQLNTTATPGQIDDDATAGSRVIGTISLDVANGGAAGLVAGVINYPVVGRTL